MNRKLTIGLVVVFAVLLVYVLIIQRPKDIAADVTPTVRPTEYLFALTLDQIGGFRIDDRVNTGAVALARDPSGGWTLSEPGPQPADLNAADTAASTLTALTVATTITSTTDLMLFGVLSPTYQLRIDLLDGTHRSAAIGDKTPTGTAYYVLREGDTNVITVATASLDPVLGLLTNPPVIPPTATPTAEITATVAVTGTVAPTGTP